MQYYTWHKVVNHHLCCCIELNLETFNFRLKGSSKIFSELQTDSDAGIDMYLIFIVLFRLLLKLLMLRPGKGISISLFMYSIGKH